MARKLSREKQNRSIITITIIMTLIIIIIKQKTNLLIKLRIMEYID